jgi:hypothetical protein
MANPIEELRARRQRDEIDRQKRQIISEQVDKINAENKVFAASAVNAFYQTDVGPAMILLKEEGHYPDPQIKFKFRTHSKDYPVLSDWYDTKNSWRDSDMLLKQCYVGGIELISLEIHLSWGRDPHRGKNANLDYTYPIYGFSVAYTKDGSFSFTSANGETRITSNQWHQNDVILGQMMQFCLENPVVHFENKTISYREEPQGGASAWGGA